MVTTPQGGKTPLRIRDQTFNDADGHVFSTIVLRDKSVDGRAIPATPPASWHYE